MWRLMDSEFVTRSACPCTSEFIDVFGGSNHLCVVCVLIQFRFVLSWISCCYCSCFYLVVCGLKIWKICHLDVTNSLYFSLVPDLIYPVSWLLSHLLTPLPINTAVLLRVFFKTDWCIIPPVFQTPERCLQKSKNSVFFTHTDLLPGACTPQGMISSPKSPETFAVAEYTRDSFTSSVHALLHFTSWSRFSFFPNIAVKNCHPLTMLASRTSV